jgi:hypothetical protein
MKVLIAMLALTALAGCAQLQEFGHQVGCEMKLSDCPWHPSVTPMMRGEWEGKP